ncbi:MAG: DUF1178 family protein [Betaproteobacteria bacterium]|nr:DUF1178 family protein [Betaproteobacteria bacterium]
MSCAEGHRFEGWFALADDFARQAAAELVRCPLCNDAKIGRAKPRRCATRASSSRRCRRFSPANRTDVDGGSESRSPVCAVLRFWVFRRAVSSVGRAADF